MATGSALAQARASAAPGENSRALFRRNSARRNRRLEHSRAGMLPAFLLGQPFALARFCFSEFATTRATGW